MRHAVFADRTSRVTVWSDWNRAQDEWARLDAQRGKRGGLDVRFFEVRSSDDPKFKGLPYEPWVALPVHFRPKYVKLSRPARDRLIKLGREAGGRDGAADAIMTELLGNPQWSHLEAVVISDYAWAAANFCFPQEAKYL